MRRWLGVASVGLASVGIIALVLAASASAAPSGLSLTAIPRVIPASGGAVRIMVHARNAGSCRLVEVPGSERPFNCSS